MLSEDVHQGYTADQALNANENTCFLVFYFVVFERVDGCITLNTSM